MRRGFPFQKKENGTGVYHYADTVLLSLAVLYVALPIMIFFAGWTKEWIAVLSCIICVWFIVQLIIKLTNIDVEIDGSKKSNGIYFWLISIIVLGLWVFFSGIGGFSYQTNDFAARNPMFHDLLDHPWPVYFDMKEEPAWVRELLAKDMQNANSAAYVYYFTWWLPVAAMAKLFHWNRLASDAMLLVWAVLGVFFVLYCLVKYFEKHSYWILGTFILFGGMDFVIYVLVMKELPVNTHIEWWANSAGIQYSANTTQLYWVFNQSIPVWLILALFLLIKDKRLTAGLCALTFAYSPFAAIGIIPIAAASCLQGKGNIRSKIKDMISVENVLIPFMILILYGSFYMQNSNSLGKTGFTFAMHPRIWTFVVYIVFLVVEVFVYLVPIVQYARKWPYYWVILAELTVLPLFSMGMNNDFTMRASIPPLFLMMVIIVKYLLDEEVKAVSLFWRRAAAAIVLTGFLTSVSELQRNIGNTLRLGREECICDPMVSFANMKIKSNKYIRMCFLQYLPVDYQDKFFYKYIAKERHT